MTQGRGGPLGVAQANVHTEHLNPAERTSAPVKAERPERTGKGPAGKYQTSVRCGKDRH